MVENSVISIRKHQILQPSKIKVSYFEFLVRASYLEIYQEEIRDLLSKDQSKRLQLKERGDTGVQV